MEKIIVFDTDFPVLKGNDLKILLKKNEILIKQSRIILQKVLDRLIVQDKVIFLCDEKGYIIDIMGEISNIQYFFEHGFKLGVSMAAENVGNNAVRQVLIKKSCLVEVDGHEKASLKDWTSIAVPVVLNKRTNGIVCILIKIDKEHNQCKLIMELIRDYLTVLLKQYYSQELDKSRFFGLLILDNKFKFTPKEIEILYHLNLNKRIKDLPKVLHISNNTMKTHLKNIYGKMNVNNLSECISFLHKYFKQYMNI